MRAAVEHQAANRRFDAITGAQLADRFGEVGDALGPLSTCSLMPQLLNSEKVAPLEIAFFQRRATPQSPG